MKISHDKTHPFVKEIYYPELLSRKCMHFINFGCWFCMIFLGTVLLGLSTSNNSVTIDFCTDTQSFCSHNLLVNASGTYNLYLKLTNFHQNNRDFMDAFSLYQIHGEVGNPDRCGNFYTYGSLGLSQTVGGYRVNSTAHLHPCGQVMSNFQVDAVYLVDASGGTPQLGNYDLVSAYNKDNHFIHLNQYQLAQWVDVQSQRFVNFFLIPTTSTKYQLLGVADLLAENYEVVMQNNLPTRGQFSKQLVITEVNGLGIENHLLGFTLFSYGILLLFLHVYLCYRWKK